MGTIASLDVNLGMNVGSFITSAGKARGAMTDLGQVAERIYEETRTAAEQYATKLGALNGLYKRGQLDATTYARAVKKLGEEFRKSKEAESGNGFFGSVFAQVAGGVTAANLAARAITGFGHALVDAGSRALRLAADFEKAEVAFRTMYRSADRAREMMQELKQFSAETPFEFPEIKDAAVKLAGFGTESRQIVPTLRLLGDLAAGTGANINELAETYGKARIQGRAFSRDIYEFSNRGIPIQEALAKQFGISRTEIMAMVEAGAVGFGEIQRALASLTAEGGKFHGGLEAQSQTLHGLASTIKDNVNLALAEFGERLAVNLQLKQNAQSTVEWTNALKTELAPALALVTKDLLDLAKVGLKTSLLSQLFSLPGVNNGGGALSTIHESIVRLNLSMARLRGDTQAEIDLLNELGEIASRVDKQRFGGGPKPDEEKLKFEDNLPNTSLADSITKTNEELRKQIITFGASADAIKIWELQQQGATREQLAFAYAASERLAAFRAQKTAMKEAAKAAEHLRKEEADLVSELQKKIATFDKSNEAERLFAFEQEHGVTAASQMAHALLEQLEGLRAKEKAAKSAAKTQKELADRAKDIIEQSRTPLEKYQARIAELQKLFEAGLITKEQGIAAAQKAHKDYLSEKHALASHSHEEAKPGALLKGSAAAFSALNRAGKPNAAAKTQRQQLKEAQEQTRRQRNIEKLLKQTGQPVVIQNF